MYDLFVYLGEVVAYSFVSDRFVIWQIYDRDWSCATPVKYLVLKLLVQLIDILRARVLISTPSVTLGARKGSIIYGPNGIAGARHQQYFCPYILESKPYLYI